MKQLQHREPMRNARALRFGAPDLHMLDRWNEAWGESYIGGEGFTQKQMIDDAGFIDLVKFCSPMLRRTMKTDFLEGATAVEAVRQIRTAAKNFKDRDDPAFMDACIYAIFSDFGEIDPFAHRDLRAAWLAFADADKNPPPRMALGRLLQAGIKHGWVPLVVGQTIH